LCLRAFAALRFVLILAMTNATFGIIDLPSMTLTRYNPIPKICMCDMFEEYTAEHNPLTHTQYMPPNNTLFSGVANLVLPIEWK
jgi:hypothetical protein